jgi:RimJ/RimL family protein N-acetyltransferase
MSISTPTLTGQRCILRPFRSEDAASLARHADNRAIWRNLLDLFPHPYTPADAEAWIDYCLRGEDGHVNFAIEADAECCGVFTLRPTRSNNQDYVELGYWLGEAHWGRGIMTEAVTLAADFAFDTLRANRVEARVYGWAAGSQRVLEKCGFTLEGRLRRRMFKDGEHTDQLVYGLLPADRATLPR